MPWPEKNHELIKGKCFFILNGSEIRGLNDVVGQQFNYNLATILKKAFSQKAEDP